jgi:hypothetical protein
MIQGVEQNTAPMLLTFRVGNGEALSVSVAYVTTLACWLFAVLTPVDDEDTHPVK